MAFKPYLINLNTKDSTDKITFQLNEPESKYKPATIDTYNLGPIAVAYFGWAKTDNNDLAIFANIVRTNNIDVVK